MSCLSMTATDFRHRAITMLLILVEVSVKVSYQSMIPYSGKFSYGANFRMFRMLHPLYENKNCENLNVQTLLFHT